MRKRTSKARRYRHQVKVLKSEVMSPRIAWFNFLGALRIATKATLCIGVLLALAFGIQQAAEHTFHKNPDFRLQAINLNPNSALDESSLVNVLEIDLSGNIFDFDIDGMEKRLLEVPAVSQAEVKRVLPGTLEFQITARKPIAWIACPEESFPATREVGSLLVDDQGFTYVCEPLQRSESEHLPILLLAPDPSFPVSAGASLVHPQYTRCLHLLKAIHSYAPEEISSVESISQEKEWSLSLTTRSGTVATFGLGSHERQIDYLKRAQLHATEKGYRIATINLIPKQNVPITVSSESEPPRAIPVILEDLPETSAARRNADLRTLLNRN